MKLPLKYFVLFLLVAALVPYFVICFYALPFADDFCFGWTASENISSTQKFLNQYFYWNGRYTADVLVNLHPLANGGIINYQILITASILITPVVLYFFIKEFTGVVDAIIVALLVTLFYLNYQPNVTEGIYWFIGILNYHLCNLLFVFQLTLLIKSFRLKGKAKIVLQVIAFALLIVAIGFNEIGAMLFPCFYLAAYLMEKRKVFFVFFVAAFIASAFVFFSPGNFVRSNEFENRFDWLHSVLYSSLQTIRFLARWILNLPFALLSSIVIINADKIKSRITIDYRLLLATLFFVVFIGSFLPYFATGVLGQHRTINFVFFFFILLWVLFLLSVSEKFLLHEKLQRFKSEGVLAALLLVSIFLMAITGNGIKMIVDFKQSNFKKYETAFYERKKVILQNPNATIKKLSVIPNTFQIVDVREDSTWWVDKCMRKYYLPLP